MKLPISKLTTGNTYLRPIGAALHDDVQWTGPTPDNERTSPFHVAAQDMADAVGLEPLSGFADHWPSDCGADYGGDNAPFDCGGPLDRGTDADTLAESWALVMHDMGVNVRGLGMAGCPDGDWPEAESIPYDAAQPDTWHGPYLVRSARYGSGPEVTRVVMLGAHRDDDGFPVAASLWLVMPDPSLLLSDARGQYIPRDFVQGCCCLEIATDDDGNALPDTAPLCGLEPTDDGTAMLEWVPGTFTSRSPKDGFVTGQYRGHVLAFYAEANVDTRWEFDEHALDDLRDCLNPDGEYYWESWEAVMRRCQARLQVTGVLCDGSEDMAEFDGHLHQSGDLWVVWLPSASATNNIPVQK